MEDSVRWKRYMYFLEREGSGFVLYGEGEKEGGGLYEDRSLISFKEELHSFNTKPLILCYWRQIRTWVE